MLDFINVKIGVDIENIDRFSKLERKKDFSFLDKVYTQSELNYCYSKKSFGQHLAARFSAKEAVVKAVSALGKKDLMYGDIEIVNNERGIPEIFINKDGFDNIEVSVSMSHCKDRVIANALVFEK